MPTRRDLRERVRVLETRGAPGVLDDLSPCELVDYADIWRPVAPWREIAHDDHFTLYRHPESRALRAKYLCRIPDDDFAPEALRWA